MATAGDDLVARMLRGDYMVMKSGQAYRGGDRTDNGWSGQWAQNGGPAAMLTEDDLARAGISAQKVQGDHGWLDAEINWPEVTAELNRRGFKAVQTNDKNYIARGILNPDGTWLVQPKVVASMGNALGDFVGMASLMLPAVGGIVGAAGSAAAPGAAAAAPGASAVGTNVSSLAQAISSGLVDPAIGAQIGSAAAGSLADAIPQIVITGSKAAAGGGLSSLGAAAAGTAALGGAAAMAGGDSSGGADYSNEGKNYSGNNGLDPAKNSPVNSGGGTASIPGLSDALKTGLKQLLGGSGAGGGVNLNDIISLLKNNENYTAGKDQLTQANADYKAAQEFNKTQIDRVTGLADVLKGRLTGMLDKPSAVSAVGAYTAPQTQLASSGDLSNNHYVLAAKSNAAATAGVGAAASKADQEATNSLTRANQATDTIRDRLTSMGDRKEYGQTQVDDVASQLYQARVGAIDRALAKTSSSGFADTLRSGLSNSTFAADTRDDVARRFGAEYAAVDAQSRVDAGNLVKTYSDLQEQQRAGSLGEVLKAYDPTLDANLYSTARGNATNLTTQFGNLSAADANRATDAIKAADAASQVEGHWAVDAAKTAYEGRLRGALAEDTNDAGMRTALVNALTQSNKDAMTAAGNIVTTAGGNVRSAAELAGALQQNYYSSVMPAVNAAGTVVNPFLSSLSGLFSKGASSAADSLTKWLDGLFPG